MTSSLRYCRSMRSGSATRHSLSGGSCSGRYLLKTRLLAAAHDEVEDRDIHMLRLVQDRVGDSDGRRFGTAEIERRRQPERLVCRNGTRGHGSPDDEVDDQRRIDLCPAVVGFNRAVEGQKSLGFLAVEDTAFHHMAFEQLHVGC